MCSFISSMVHAKKPRTPLLAQTVHLLLVWRQSHLFIELIAAEIWTQVNGSRCDRWLVTMGPVSTRGLFGLLATSSEHMLGQPETAFYELKQQLSTNWNIHAEALPEPKDVILWEILPQRNKVESDQEVCPLSFLTSRDMGTQNREDRTQWMASISLSHSCLPPSQPHLTSFSLHPSFSLSSSWPEFLWPQNLTLANFNI